MKIDDRIIFRMSVHQHFPNFITVLSINFQRMKKNEQRFFLNAICKMLVCSSAIRSMCVVVLCEND